MQGTHKTICSGRRDLQDSRLVIASLLATTTTTTLPSRVLALYVHNGVKIYSHWLQTLANNWEESCLDQIRSITSALEGQLVACARSADVELQQRAAELSGVLALVRKGLDAPRTSSHQNVTCGFGDTDVDDLDLTPSDTLDKPQPAPPTLRLLAPLFTAHELNPVNPKAQSMVAVPEGLDLDVEIVSQAARPRVAELDLSGDDAEVDPFGRPLHWEASSQVPANGEEKRRKKGKASTGGKKSKAERRSAQAEDPEELERVSFCAADLLSVMSGLRAELTPRRPRSYDWSASSGSATTLIMSGQRLRPCPRRTR